MTNRTLDADDLATLSESTDSPFPTPSAVKEAQAAIAERLECELRGAWRAGYDYLHVYGPTMGGCDPDEPVTIRQAVFPAHSSQPPRRSVGGEMVYLHTYDLTSVPDAVLRRAIRGDFDPAALLEGVDR